MWFVAHLVPVDFAKCSSVLLRLGLTTKPVEQVSSPLLGRDALAVEGLDVVFHVWQEVVQTSDGSLEVEQEVRTLSSADGTDLIAKADLFIRYLVVRLVG